VNVPGANIRPSSVEDEGIAVFSYHPWHELGLVCLVVCSATSQTSVIEHLTNKNISAFSGKKVYTAFFFHKVVHFLMPTPRYNALNNSKQNSQLFTGIAVHMHPTIHL
jgi:hypothetical protein